MIMNVGDMTFYEIKSNMCDKNRNKRRDGSARGAWMEAGSCIDQGYVTHVDVRRKVLLVVPAGPRNHMSTSSRRWWTDFSCTALLLRLHGAQRTLQWPPVYPFIHQWDSRCLARHCRANCEQFRVQCLAPGHFHYWTIWARKKTRRKHNLQLTILK